MSYRNFNIWDIGLTKAAVFFATLFLISIWPAFADWANETHWAWFLTIAVLAAIKPMLKVFKE